MIKNIGPYNEDEMSEEEKKQFLVEVSDKEIQSAESKRDKKGKKDADEG